VFVVLIHSILQLTGSWKNGARKVAVQSLVWQSVSRGSSVWRQSQHDGAGGAVVIVIVVAVAARMKSPECRRTE